MRILQINKFYYRRRGAETYFLDLIELLQSRGHEVAVFAMDHPDNEPSVFGKYFVPYLELGQSVHLPLGQKMQAVGRVLWSKEAQHRLEALLQEFKPDIAHIHNIYHQLSPSILATLKRHNVPIVQTLHDYKLLCPNYSLFTEGSVCERCKGGKYYNAVTHRCVQDSYAASALAATEMYLHKALKIYERSINCFITPSQFLRDKIANWDITAQAVEVVPNFIDVASITPQYTHKHYLLYMGGWMENKGIKILLDIFRDNCYDIELHVAGGGPLLSELRSQAGPHVTVLGQLSSEHIQQEIAGAQAVIVPSLVHDNFPYSVIEPLAHGKPVLGAQRGGIPELIQPNSTGWLFEPSERASLMQALSTFHHTSDAQLITMGKTARQWVEQHLTIDQHYRKLLAIYERYVQSSSQ